MMGRKFPGVRLGDYLTFMDKPRVIDLFAGAGGLSLGAELAGCEVDTAFESDAWACETLAANHDGVRVEQGDLRAVTDDWIRRELKAFPDLLVGGPPCQGFSHAGRPNKDPKDPRNSLFREFIRFVQVLEPESVVIENVPGILRAKTAAGEKVQDIITEELEQLGYTVKVAILHAELFGVPQIRRRVFFMASQRGLPKLPSPTHGEADLLLVDQPRVLTLHDAISDLPIVDVGFKGPLVGYKGPPANRFQREMREGASPNLANHVPMRHSQRMIDRFATIKPGQSGADAPVEHAPRKRLRGAEDPAVSYDQNNRRMHWDKPCHTIAASFYANFLHPDLNRNFTPREGARIQTFPDSYEFHGKPTVVSHKLLAREGRDAERHLCQYNQIGNAVPPKLGKAVVSALVELSRVQSPACAA